MRETFCRLANWVDSRSSIARRVRYQLQWERNYRQLRHPKTRSELSLDEGLIDHELTNCPIPFSTMSIEVAEYRNWLSQVDYRNTCPEWFAIYESNLYEKSLEHFVAAQLLDLKPGQIYIDVASEYGAAAEAYSRLYEVDAYRQDLSYPSGFHGKIIGSDAATMPLPNEFADAMALHCSFEHFENDSDSGFIRELSRVLKPGGICVIAPLYLCHVHACLTNPVLSVPAKTPYDHDTILYASKSWRNCHGRFYDVAHLIERVWKHRGKLEMHVHTVSNFREVDPSCYLRHVAVLKKPR